MKKFLFFTFLVATYTFAVAQEVKVKKGVVYIDGKETLKFVSLSMTRASLQTLEGGELLSYVWKHSPSYSSGYHIISFVNPKLSLSTDFGYTYTLLIKHLLRDGVLVNGKFDSEKVKQFVAKHDRGVDK